MSPCFPPWGFYFPLPCLSHCGNNQIIQLYITQGPVMRLSYCVSSCASKPWWKWSSCLSLPSDTNALNQVKSVGFWLGDSGVYQPHIHISGKRIKTEDSPEHEDPSHLEWGLDTGEKASCQSQVKKGGDPHECLCPCLPVLHVPHVRGRPCWRGHWGWNWRPSGRWVWDLPHHLWHHLLLLCDRHPFGHHTR